MKSLKNRSVFCKELCFLLGKAAQMPSAAGTLAKPLATPGTGHREEERAGVGEDQRGRRRGGKEKEAHSADERQRHLHPRQGSLPHCQQEDKDLINSAYTSAWKPSEVTWGGNETQQSDTKLNSPQQRRHVVSGECKWSPRVLELGIFVLVIDRVNQINAYGMGSCASGVLRIPSANVNNTATMSRALCQRLYFTRIISCHFCRSSDSPHSTISETERPGDLFPLTRSKAELGHGSWLVSSFHVTPQQSRRPQWMLRSSHVNHL